MKKAVKWFFRGLVSLVVLGLLLAVLLLQKIDRTPYKETDYYKRMSEQLDTFRVDTTKLKGDFLKAGWSKVSITPRYFPDIAGYGIREKASCVHDSVFVRTFVLDNGITKTAFISVDLLIFPPILKTKLYENFEKIGYTPENLYFTATHSHSAPGGWAGGLAGRLLAGEYRAEYVDTLVSRTVMSIKLAERNLAPASVGVGKVNASEFVRNRINMPDSEVDPWVRILKIKKETGEKAFLLTYSAHANCLKIKNNCLSGDYPGQLISRIESSGKADFAMYGAGMVGSHIPTPVKENDKDLRGEEYMMAYGDSIANLVLPVLDSIKCSGGTELYSVRLDLPLRAPQLKVSKDWCLKPWVFDWLFGDYYPKLKIFKVNNIVFIGTPCDFSGELMKDFEAICKEKNLELYITSFNGGYIGYVNADKYYDENKAETRDMTWFGPYNQAYFTEVIQKILKKI